MESGSRGLLGRSGKESTEDDRPPDDEVPPRGKRKAFGAAHKPQMGVSLFAVRGQRSRSPVYIRLDDMEHDGEKLRLFYGHMTVTIEGKALEALAEGLRRQVVYYIQAQHTSEFEAEREACWIKSITIGPPAEEGELGQWAG